MSPASTARQVALDLIAAVLRRKRPLDQAIEDNPDISALAGPAPAVASATRKEAPLGVTVRADDEAWCEKLQAMKLPTGSLRRAAGGSVVSLPGYAEGAWWIQDAAASLPARLLDGIAGRQVVDLCAAPGGKTAQLVNAGAYVTAIDRSTRRLDRLVTNLHPLRLSVPALAAGAPVWHPDYPVHPP